MAYSHVISIEKTLGATSDAIDTTGADLIVIVLASDDAVTVSDSKGNTWNKSTTIVNVDDGSTRVSIFWAENPSVGTGHTFSQNGATYGALFVAAFSGALTSSVQDQESAGAEDTNTSLATGSATPSEDNELLVAGIVTGLDSTGHSVDSSFVLDNQIDGVNGVNYGGALAYKIQTTAGAENPTFSWAGSATCAAIMLTFKAAPVAGGGFGPEVVVLLGQGVTNDQ